VWAELYGETHNPPPIEWIDGWVHFPTRTAGLALPGWKIQVSRNDARTRTGSGPFVFRQFSTTKFAHELMHYHTYLRTGDIDAAHWRGEWDLADTVASEVLWNADL